MGFGAHYVRTCPPVVLQPGFPETSGAEFWGFAELFQKRPLHAEWRLRGVSAKNGIFFLPSFFFCASCLKRKSVKEISVFIESASNYDDYLSFIHFFFGTTGAKKKFPKRNAECAHAARAPLLVESHF